MSLEYNLDFISDKSKKSSIKKALSILERAYYKNIEQSSFFLDPFEQAVIESIAQKNNIEVIFEGGSDYAERKIFVANYYYNPISSSNYFKILKFSHNGLTHPDVLGALMSLNISRESVGDIVINDNICEFAALVDDASFIKYNLNKIKRESIEIDFKINNSLQIPKPSYQEYSGFVSSLRLDNLISEFINTSRSKAKQIIKQKNVKVNFEVIDDPGKIISENSTISIRKEGRFVFDEITGESKKGNSHITYRKIVWFI